MEDEIISRIRGFNRFYVRIIGLLESSIMQSGYSLTEAHVLNVLYHNQDTTARGINKELKLDEGYLSRVIKKLMKASLIKKVRSKNDKRIYVMNLTVKGRSEYLKLDAQSATSVASSIAHLSNKDKLELASLMDRIKYLLKQNNT